MAGQVGKGLRQFLLWISSVNLAQHLADLDPLLMDTGDILLHLYSFLNVCPAGSEYGHHAVPVSFYP